MSIKKREVVMFNTAVVIVGLLLFIGGGEVLKIAAVELDRAGFDRQMLEETGFSCNYAWQCVEQANANDLATLGAVMYALGSAILLLAVLVVICTLVERMKKKG